MNNQQQKKIYKNLYREINNKKNEKIFSDVNEHAKNK